jgi:hypothetical protein
MWLGVALRADFLRQLCSGFILNVQKGHFRALPGELFYDSLANSTRSARHHHHPAAQAGVGRELRGLSCRT